MALRRPLLPVVRAGKLRATGSNSLSPHPLSKLVMSIGGVIICLLPGVDVNGVEAAVASAVAAT